MSVSVAIIARNSHDVIERCLESVKDADEIVVLDTGSDDTKTMDIARKYTDKVYEYWGCNEGGKRDGLLEDFSDARNKCLEYCTMTHVLTIDTDEVLQKGTMDRLKRFEGIAMSIVCISDRTGEQHRQPRLYTNTPKIRWFGAAHNYLKLQGTHSDIEIKYYSNQQKKKDPDRTMRILERYVKKHPRECAREMYYLSKEYFRRGWYKKSERILRKYVQKSKFTAEKTDGFVMLARSCAAQNKYEDAVNATMSAIHLNPDMKEAHLLAAELSPPEQRLKFKYMADVSGNANVLFIRPDKRKRVTILSRADYAGSGYRIADAVRIASKGQIDIESIVEYEGQGTRHFTIKTGPSIQKIGYHVAQQRIETSDVLHFKGDWLHEKDWCGINLHDQKKIYYLTGSFFRRGGHKAVSFGTVPVEKYVADFVSAGTPDLCYNKDIQFVEVPWMDFQYKFKPGKQFRVMHIPSSKQKKGTDIVEKAMDLLPEVEFVCATGIPYGEMMKLKSTAHIYIDQMLLPVYGNAAVEAMSMGIPVVNWDEGLYPYPTPVIKPKDQTPQALADVIREHLDWAKLKDISQNTFEFAKATHGQVGKFWVDIYNAI